jgi:hypothetical protein
MKILCDLLYFMYKSSSLAERFMEHSYIEDHNIADRYLLGKLSAEERMRFEEHCENCQECFKRLETVDGLRRGLRIVAGEEAWRSRAHVMTGLLSHVARLSSASQAILLAVIILLTALPIGWLALERGRARRELAHVTQTAAEWQRKYEEREQAGRDLMKGAQVQDQLTAWPESTREDRPRSPDEADKVALSQAGVPVFALSVMRNSSPDLAQPINRIKLSPTSKLIILLLELGPDPGLQAYRATISTADGRNIWRARELSPTSDNTLALGFNSGLFKPGNHSLTLEGLTTQKRYVLTAQYTFSVVTQ